MPLILDVHTSRLLNSRARDKLGSRIEISNAMIAITTSSSISVNPCFRFLTTTSPIVAANNLPLRRSHGPRHGHAAGNTVAHTDKRRFADARDNRVQQHEPLKHHRASWYKARWTTERITIKDQPDAAPLLQSGAHPQHQLASRAVPDSDNSSPAKDLAIHQNNWRLGENPEQSAVW